MKAIIEIDISAPFLNLSSSGSRVMGQNAVGQLDCRIL